MFHGPIPGRYIRFLPVGNYTSGSTVIQVLLTSIPGALNSVGTNSSITNAGIGYVVGTGSATIGTSTNQVFQTRVTGSAAVATAVHPNLGAVSGQFIHITDIFWSMSSGVAGTDDRLVNLAAVSSPSGGQDFLMRAPGTTVNDVNGWRQFRDPWKISTVNNVGLNYTIGGTATGTYYLSIHGYYSP
jgi:hypothetical protein